MEKGRDFAEVYTVDSYQGQEADVVLFSAVRSQSHNKYSRSVGFLQDLRRANVALTRARLALWVICNADTLSVNEMWREFLSHASAERAIKRFQTRNLVQRKVREQTQEAADIGILRVAPELPVIIRAQHVGA